MQGSISLELIHVVPLCGVCSVTHEYEDEMPPEGMDILITAVAAEHLHPVTQLFLTYRVNYGKEKTVEMDNDGEEFTQAAVEGC